MSQNDLCPEMKMPVSERHIKCRSDITQKKMNQELIEVSELD
jgi:hypothetical protein